MQLAPVFSSVKWGVARSLLGSWDSKRPSTEAPRSVWHVGSHWKMYDMLLFIRIVSSILSIRLIPRGRGCLAVGKTRILP